MVLQLLMETASGLSGLRSIMSDGLFEGKRTTIVLLPHSVVFVNAFSGAVIQTIEFPRRDMVRLVDCVYVETSRCFVAAFSNATLTVVPQELMSSLNAEYTTWPQQPLKLLTHNSRGGVLVVCIDSTVWHLTLSDDKIVKPTFTKASGKSRDNLLCIDACSTADGVSIIRKVNTGSSKRSTSRDYIDCSLLSWIVPVSEGGSSRILEEAACVFSNLKIRMDEKFMSICAHLGSRSISVFFSSPCDTQNVGGGDSYQLRWQKYDNYNGTLLFEKRMGKDSMRGTDQARNAFSAISAGPLLWLVFDGRASLWDPRYGIELCNVATYIPLDFPPGRSADFHSIGFPSDISTPQTSIYALTLCVPHVGGCSIFNTNLKVPTSQTTGTLCNALGRLSPRSVAGAGKHAIYESSKGLRLSDRAIITSMSLEMQKDLLAAEATVKHEKLLSEKELKNDRKRSVEEIGPDSKHRLPAADKKLKYNQAEWTNFIRGHADRVLDIRREKILYLDIPVSTTRCFLDRFEALAGNSVPLFNDWNMLHPLIMSGTVSTANGGSNASLISQAIASRRFDILATICRYTADLSERVAVQVLIACADAKPEDLSNLHIDQVGVLRYYRVTSANGFVRQGPQSLASKRPKKSKTVTIGVLMSMMIESIIRRRAAYSTILLSDTLKKFISPSFAVILLRVIMLFLKGLCTPLLLSAADGIENPVVKHRSTEDSLSSVFKCVSTHTGSPTASYNDIDINNAVCWAEALLDSHFSSLAFRASFHASTREALSCVMRTVATASDASQEVEKVLGLWTHVTRAARSGALPEPPSTALYQREALRL